VNAADEFVDFIVEFVPQKSLEAFRISNAASERLCLIQKERETELLPDERMELEDSLLLEHLMILARAKAALAATRIERPAP
jgi:hypothetical protein